MAHWPVVEVRVRGHLGQVSVDGGAGDAELVGDLGEGVAAFAVVAGLLIDLSGQLYLGRAPLSVSEVVCTACIRRMPVIPDLLPKRETRSISYSAF